MANSLDFAYDYIYHYEQYKERHPNYLAYRFGRLKAHRPRVVGTLYRGLYFETEEKYEDFLIQIHTKQWTLSDLSSWTKVEDVATHFAVVSFIKKKKGYCGVVVKAKNVLNKQILFDSLMAHMELLKAGREFPNDTALLKEMELVLKPTTVEIESIKVMRFAELNKLIKQRKRGRKHEENLIQ